MEESNKGVEAKHPGNHPSEEKGQGTGATQHQKPVASKAKPKTTAKNNQARGTSSSSIGNRSKAADSSTLKDNAERAEALEHENIATQNKNAYSKHMVSEPSTEKTPDDFDKETQTDSPPLSNEEVNIAPKDKAGKHKAKLKSKPLVKATAEISQGGANVKADPEKAIKNLQKKTIKSEKKVGKLKKKVKRAEKSDVKKSKLRLLKEKLIKAFSKWQRRKKKLEKAPK